MAMMFISLLISLLFDHATAQIQHQTCVLSNREWSCNYYSYAPEGWRTTVTNTPPPTCGPATGVFTGADCPMRTTFWNGDVYEYANPYFLMDSSAPFNGHIEWGMCTLDECARWCENVGQDCLGFSWEEYECFCKQLKVAPVISYPQQGWVGISGFLRISGPGFSGQPLTTTKPNATANNWPCMETSSCCTSTNGFGVAMKRCPSTLWDGSGYYEYAAASLEDCAELCTGNCMAIDFRWPIYCYIITSVYEDGTWSTTTDRISHFYQDHTALTVVPSAGRLVGGVASEQIRSPVSVVAATTVGAEETVAASPGSLGFEGSLSATMSAGSEALSTSEPEVVVGESSSSTATQTFYPAASTLSTLVITSTTTSTALDTKAESTSNVTPNFPPLGVPIDSASTRRSTRLSDLGFFSSSISSTATSSAATSFSEASANFAPGFVPISTILSSTETSSPASSQVVESSASDLVGDSSAGQSFPATEASISGPPFEVSASLAISISAEASVSDPQVVLTPSISPVATDLSAASTSLEFSLSGAGSVSEPQATVLSLSSLDDIASSFLAGSAISPTAEVSATELQNAASSVLAESSERSLAVSASLELSASAGASVLGLQDESSSVLPFATSLPSLASLPDISLLPAASTSLGQSGVSSVTAAPGGPTLAASASLALSASAGLSVSGPQSIASSLAAASFSLLSTVSESSVASVPTLSIESSLQSALPVTASIPAGLSPSASASFAISVSAGVTVSASQVIVSPPPPIASLPDLGSVSSSAAVTTSSSRISEQPASSNPVNPGPTACPAANGAIATVNGRAFQITCSAAHCGATTTYSGTGAAITNFASCLDQCTAHCTGLYFMSGLCMEIVGGGQVCPYAMPMYTAAYAVTSPVALPTTTASAIAVISSPGPSPAPTVCPAANGAITTVNGRQFQLTCSTAHCGATSTYSGTGAAITNIASCIGQCTGACTGLYFTSGLCMEIVAGGSRCPYAMPMYTAAYATSIGDVPASGATRPATTTPASGGGLGGLLGGVLA